MWYGIPRGSDLGVLAGKTGFSIAVGQAKYWIYLDPDWDYHRLNYTNWQAFFDKTVQMMEPTIGTDDADYSPFRDAGHKLIMWHGWADQIIMPEGTIDLYDAVTNTISGGNVSKTQKFARLFMAPNVGHCGMDTDVFFEALVDWVEKEEAPEKIIVNQAKWWPWSPARTRPLCPHPEVAVYKGTGSTDDAQNFRCGANPVKADKESLNWKANRRIFGKPFLPPPGGQSEKHLLV